ncbi:MAG: hypothetical protein ACYS0K_25040 [Planctomycetota bacterium]|jgi:hypothetical protein
MKRTSSLLLGALLLIVVSGCAGSSRQTVMLPPRIDLTQHELIGVVEFDSSEEGELGSFATQRFTEEARRDQGLVRIVEVGSEDEALASVGRSEMDSETYKAIGHEHGVQTILLGRLTVSNVRPNVRIANLSSGSLSAQVDATLAVQLIETSTGASLWSSSASATQNVGQLSVFELVSCAISSYTLKGSPSIMIQGGSHGARNPTPADRTRAAGTRGTGRLGPSPEDRPGPGLACSNRPARRRKTLE